MLKDYLIFSTVYPDILLPRRYKTFKFTSLLDCWAKEINPSSDIWLLLR